MSGTVEWSSFTNFYPLPVADPSKEAKNCRRFGVWHPSGDLLTQS